VHGYFGTFSTKRKNKQKAASACPFGLPGFVLLRAKLPTKLFGAIEVRQ
jgi:hypothetical protein